MDIPDGGIDCIWTDPPYFLSNGRTTDTPLITPRCGRTMAAGR